MTERREPPDHAPERETLVAFLDYYRATLMLKAEGVTDEQARTPTAPPSDLNLMGLVRHMAAVEHHWFDRVWTASGQSWLFPSADDADLDMHPGPLDTVADAIALLHREVAAADEVIAAADLDDRARRVEQRDGVPFQPSLRWILVHLIEEYARHCGHADILRQAIDGATGD